MPNNQDIELLNIGGALSLVGGISRQHFYDLIRQGVMPQPVKLGTQCSRWVKAELIAAVNAQAAKRATKPTVRTNHQ
jgi:predicted DNA-binding transcriptional regulator AlpA